MDGSGSKPGVPLAACQGLVLKSVNKFIDRVPHHNATLVHVAIGVSNNLDVCGEFKPAKNLTTGRGH